MIDIEMRVHQRADHRVEVARLVADNDDNDAIR
jgi:hypothetical protein